MSQGTSVIGGKGAWVRGLRWPTSDYLVNVLMIMQDLWDYKSCKIYKIINPARFYKSYKILQILQDFTHLTNLARFARAHSLDNLNSSRCPHRYTFNSFKTIVKLQNFVRLVRFVISCKVCKMRRRTDLRMKRVHQTHRQDCNETRATNPPQRL